MTATTIEENKDLGKMDWEKMTSVIRSTINLDDEGNFFHSKLLFRHICFIMDSFYFCNLDGNTSIPPTAPKAKFQSAVSKVKSNRSKLLAMAKTMKPRFQLEYISNKLEKLYSKEIRK